jgi:RHS repeat-associated protein
MTYGTWGTPTVTGVNGYGTLGFRYLYVGRFDVQWDDFAGAGLLYMHARHYHPEFGRFLQPDPSALEANLYGYAENGPVSRVDPSGSESWSWSEAERRWCDLFSGWECSMWVLSSAEALAWAKALRNDWTENAFRHCIWQCLLAARTSKRKAAAWGYIHESSAARVSPTDRTVDLHNNAVGRSLASEPWAWTLSTAARLCDRAWRNGRLLTVRNGRIVYSDGDRYPRVGGR